MKNNSLTQTWIEYQRGKDYQELQGRYNQTEKNNDFYIGKQWKGIKSGDMPMPMKNFIKPICDYKIGVVSQNSLSIVYSSNNYDEEDLKEINGVSFRDQSEKICKLLSNYARKTWERNNMDAMGWVVVKEGAVSGSTFAYSVRNEKDNGIDVELVDDNNIYFSDENDKDIQSQEYILITYRRPVNQIKKEAQANGINKDQIKLIKSDDETEKQLGNKEEVKTDNGKCLCILKLYKKVNEQGRETVHMVKSTRHVEYLPETDTGLTLYPVADFGWIEKKNNIRCMGEPEPLIDNQIEVNKSLARRSIAITLGAYPKIAYSTDKIANPSQLTKVGVAIAVNGKDVEDVNKAIDYLRPTQISPDAKNYTDELVQDTRDLAGAGDVALGITNPEQASGRAVIAVRDNAVLPLNSHVARYRKFVEDLAKIWMDIWQNTAGEEGERIVIDNPTEEIKDIVFGKPEKEEPTILPTYEASKPEERPNKPVVETIPYSALQKIKANVRIDITNANPYSKYAEEQSLESLFTAGAITFEEYVDLLPTDSVVPKDKLEHLIDDRKNKQEQITNIEKEMLLKKQNMEKLATLGQGVAEPSIGAEPMAQEQQLGELEALGGLTNEMQPM